MHTLASDPKATQNSKCAESTLRRPGHTGQKPEVRSFSLLARGMKNQDPERMSRANDVETKAELTESALPRFAHDFSRIPLRPPSTGAVQAKLAINQPGDRYEQEADSVAESVMRMPEPQAQRKCACGGIPGPTGECDECRKKRLAVQRVSLRPNATHHEASFAPLSVHEVINSPGQPLDGVTRAFMEPRFGHDFSRVRVHSDSAAGESAREVNARAYTVENNIVFGTGRFATGTREGLTLLAHELTHVVQQGCASRSQPGGAPVHGKRQPDLMRSVVLDSTVSICHRVLESRKISVSQGGLRVVLLLRPQDKNVPNCGDHDFSITLSRPRTLIPDKEIATCEARTGGTRSFSFTDLSPDTYYFTIARNFDNPNCCLEGDVLAFDEPVKADSPGCEKHKSLTTLEIVHGALDIVGLIPALGAIPDGLNAVIYAAEGDWVNAGISVAAAVPFLGDGVLAAKWGGKAAIKLSEKAAVRLGEEGIAKGLKEARAVAKSEKAAAEGSKDVVKATEEVEKGAGKVGDEAAKESEKAAEKALQERIDKCLEIYAAKEALGDCKGCKGTDTPKERAEKIFCLTAEIAARERYLKADCDDVLPGSLDRIRKGQDPKGGHQKQLLEKLAALAKCSTLPTRKDTTP
jgi:hypothetical protein